ncbi:MAG TPA: DUF3048 domain-containing protein, partial [Ilumatobacteraceae bacterium]|nr:DUF3048 domain-containing protein [Ilumatobacteraceae bacterium]
TTTTVADDVARLPLRGTPVPFGFDGTRPAMVVKLDNHPDARPQSGLNEADIVFEENVESLTRFAAVFHSTDANPVGPIRSGRTQDVELLAPFLNPMFVWSGGNARVTQAIRGSGMFQIDQTVGLGVMYRRRGRNNPHDLYADMSKLYGLRPDSALPPPAQFSYLADDTEASGDQATGVKVSMDGVRVLWEWDAASSTYLRQTDGKAHKDDNGGAQWSTENVVVLTVVYRQSAADVRSPEAQTTGSGDVVVLSGGRVRTGRWTRDNQLVPFSLTDADGAVIELTPGRTVVELARANKTAVVPAGTAVADVAYP